ncbi:MAG TPA: hypothetical protein PLR96_02745, partial [Flavobacteriales bacterium]|nr:hypothetical protein [Flavobacteriales bacterium]
MRVFLSVALSLFLLRPAAQAQAVAIPGDLLIMLAPGAEAEKVADDLATVNGQPTGMQVVRLVSRPMRTWL